MKIIIFAGGTGKRFWPVSRKKSPKQFQNIVGDKPLVRLKYEYLRSEFEPQDIFLSTGINYKDEVQKILPEIPKDNFIFEPEMRDTGPAVALAVSYVDWKFPGEVLGIQWADHYIKKPDVFVSALRHAEEIVKQGTKSVLIGVPPRFPSPHRGYIKYGKRLKGLGDGTSTILAEFIRFVEKPTLEVAKEYIESGDYLWNPAYPVTTAKFILSKYKEFAPEIYGKIETMRNKKFSPEALSEFKDLEKISFDYIFSENLTHLETKVIIAEMGWNDVGEWISLHEALAETPNANVTAGHVEDLDSTSSLIYNYDKDKLVATIGLRDMVVVNTKDVVAVFHKKDNAKLKEFLKIIEGKGLAKYI